MSLDTAPTFASELVVQDKPFTDLFTAATNTCPTLDPATGVFTDATCAVANGLTGSGVLTDPGAMAQFYSNMAFRRVRWVQETFVCTKFPAEYSPTPVAMGNGQYVSPWPFDSITGGTDKTVAPINFKDTSSVVCANCHTTMNHIAPLFAHFNMSGVFQTTIQVQTPVPMTPTTKLTDWLPSGQGLSWRFSKPVTNLVDLGQGDRRRPGCGELPGGACVELGDVEDRHRERPLDRSGQHHLDARGPVPIERVQAQAGSQSDLHPRRLREVLEGDDHAQD